MSSTEQQYNGWSNRETWLASLWLNNEHSGYELLKDAMRLRVSNHKKAMWLASMIEVELGYPEMQSSFWSDMLRTAWTRVNWDEVVANNADNA